MWRALISIGLIFLAAIGAVWLSEQPGTVVLTYDRSAYEMDIGVAVIGIAGIALAVTVLLMAGSSLVNLPSRLTFASRARKRARGYQAVSRGMVAVGAGDSIAARRYANEAERLLGQEPLTLLLKAQAAQVSGNRAAAETAFSRMMDNDETRVLGLRGLFVEARRRGDTQHAVQYAAEAARLAPAASWASDAVLEARCAARDWQGALAALDRRAASGLIDKQTARRHRAVLLTADALDRPEHERDTALANAQEALKLAPDLVPAAVIVGRALSQRGDLRRAAKAVETAWRAQPHPDLADVYLNLRPGDSALDRLARAETLLKLSNHAPEGRIALARAAMEAREFARARASLEPLANERPTMRVCLLMSDLEQAEHGTTGRGREWLARAARAPRDPVWMADGVVCDQWAPISPVTGRLDAFVWQAPPDVLVAPELAHHDEVTADLDDRQNVVAIAPPPPGAPVVAPSPAALAEAETPVEPGPPPVQAAAEPVPAAPSGPAGKPNGHGYAPAPVVFPVDHAPDDPGAEAAEKPPRRGLFG